MSFRLDYSYQRPMLSEVKALYSLGLNSYDFDFESAFTTQAQIDKIEYFLEKIFRYMPFTDGHLTICPSGQDAILEMLMGVWELKAKGEGCSHFITTKVVDPYSYGVCEKFEDLGGSISYLEVDANGIVQQQTFKQFLTPRSGCVFLSWVNPLTGVVQPLEEIASYCRERDVLLCLDVSYGVGKLNLEEVGDLADIIVINGAAIGAGCSGMVYSKKNIKLPSLHFIKNPFFESVQRYPVITMAIAHALENANKNLSSITTQGAFVQHLFEQMVLDFPNVKLFAPDVLKAPMISCFIFEGYFAENLQYLLQEEGVFAQIGNIDDLLSKILQRMGYSNEVSHSALSFCLIDDLKKQDLDDLKKILEKVFNRLSNLRVV